MNKYLTKADCLNLYEKGVNALKTSYFSLKFSPDHLSAINYFSDSAKGYNNLKLFDKAIEAYYKAAESNKHINDSWAEGMNYLEISKIMLFEDRNPEGYKILKQASECIKEAGKYQ